MTVMLFLVKKSLVKKEVWYSVLLWWNSHFVPKVRDKFSRSHGRLWNWLLDLPWSWVWYLMRWFFYIYLILLATLGPGVYSASNRNEYLKHKSNSVCGE
jgi:hypothetical protein